MNSTLKTFARPFAVGILGGFMFAGAIALWAPGVQRKPISSPGSVTLEAQRARAALTDPGPSQARGSEGGGFLENMPRILRNLEPVPPPVPDDRVLQLELFGGVGVPEHLKPTELNFATQYSKAFTQLDDFPASRLVDCAIPPELVNDPAVAALAIAGLEGLNVGDVVPVVSAVELSDLYRRDVGVRQDFRSLQETRTAEIAIFALQAATPDEVEALRSYLEPIDPALAAAFPHSASNALAMLKSRRLELGRSIWNKADAYFPGSSLELRFALRSDLR